MDLSVDGTALDILHTMLVLKKPKNWPHLDDHYSYHD